MAILRHGSIGNGNYGEAQCYLPFESDAKAQKSEVTLYDKYGHVVIIDVLPTIIHIHAAE